MAELETRLRALGDELAWPETPDLAGAVMTALAARRTAGADVAAAPAAEARRGARRGHRRGARRRPLGAASAGARAARRPVPWCR